MTTTPPTRTSSEIGTCIAILRISRGWSQQSLATASGLTNSAISDYERGKVDPQAQSLVKLLRALGAPMILLDQARDFLELARNSMNGSAPPPEAGGTELPELPPALAAEIGAIASEGARFTARATRMQLGLLARLVHTPAPPALAPVAPDVPPTARRRP